MNLLSLMLAAAALQAGPALAPPVAATPIPPAEVRFCAALDRYAVRYRAAGLDEMRLDALRERRARKLAELAPDGAFTGWVGTIVESRTGFEGKAILRVQLPCRGALATRSGFLADLFDRTQIPAGSPLFAALAGLKVPAPVVVSGRFIGSRENGFRQGNASEAAKMAEPRFIVHFRSIARAPPA
jgi:hypothetical protein